MRIPLLSDAIRQESTYCPLTSVAWSYVHLSLSQSFFAAAITGQLCSCPLSAVVPSPTLRATWCASAAGRQARASMATVHQCIGGAVMIGKGPLTEVGGAAILTVAPRSSTGGGLSTAMTGRRGPLEGPAPFRTKRTGEMRNVKALCGSIIWLLPLCLKISSLLGHLI